MTRPSAAARRHALHAVLAALLAATAAAPAAAQNNFPERPVRIVVAYAAGGTADLVGRLMAEAATPILGQRVVVENRTGAGGMIGAEHVARGAADGYTLLQCTTGMMTINPELPDQRPSIDVGTDLVPVATSALSTYGVVVGASAPYRTLGDVVAAARARPNSVTYGSAGIGSVQHLAGERLARLAGAPLVHVPYRGAAPAVVDLIAGRTGLLITNLGDVMRQITGGELRLLALGDRRGSPLFPDVPAAADAVPGFETSSWYGLCGPRGLPDAAVRRWTDAMRRVLDDPELRQRFAENGLAAQFEDPAAFGRRIAADRQTWGGVIREAGIRAE